MWEFVKGTLTWRMMRQLDLHVEIGKGWADHTRKSYEYVMDGMRRWTFIMVKCNLRHNHWKNAIMQWICSDGSLPTRGHRHIIDNMVREMRIWTIFDSSKCFLLEFSDQQENPWRAPLFVGWKVRFFVKAGVNLYMTMKIRGRAKSAIICYVTIYLRSKCWKNAIKQWTH